MCTGARPRQFSQGGKLPQGGRAGGPATPCGGCAGRASGGAGAVALTLRDVGVGAAGRLHPPFCPLPHPACSMRVKRVNLLFALVAVMLFSFSCFCISRMTQTSKRRVTSPASFPAFPPSGLQDCWGGRVREEEGDMGTWRAACSCVRGCTGVVSPQCPCPAGG